MPARLLRYDVPGDLTKKPLWCYGIAERVDSCDQLYATCPACPAEGSQMAIVGKHADCVAQSAKRPESLAKVVPILGLILMALHIIWPFNVPGLRKRRDFWKIAVAIGLAIVATALLRDHASISP